MQRHPPTRAEKTLINDLAKQTGRSFEEAQSAYERELEKTASEANVTAYVKLFARKRAREALKQSH